MTTIYLEVGVDKFKTHEDDLQIGGAQLFLVETLTPELHEHPHAAARMEILRHLGCHGHLLQELEGALFPHDIRRLLFQIGIDLARLGRHELDHRKKGIFDHESAQDEWLVNKLVEDINDQAVEGLPGHEVVCVF